MALFPVFVANLFLCSQKRSSKDLLWGDLPRVGGRVEISSDIPRGTIPFGDISYVHIYLLLCRARDW